MHWLDDSPTGRRLSRGSEWEAPEVAEGVVQGSKHNFYITPFSVPFPRGPCAPLCPLQAHLPLPVQMCAQVQPLFQQTVGEGEAGLSVGAPA